MAAENAVMRRIWGALSARRFARATLFRLNTGRAWISNLGPAGAIRMADGSVLVKAARSIALGLSAPNGDPIKGACDLPGFTSVVITPEMVGRTVAVFTSVETKASKGGRTSADQMLWMQNIHRAGGIAGVAASEAQANEIIDSWIEGRTPLVM